jgi:hypothetical protein
MLFQSTANHENGRTTPTETVQGYFLRNNRPSLMASSHLLLLADLGGGSLSLLLPAQESSDSSLERNVNRSRSEIELAVKKARSKVPAATLLSSLA